MFLVLIQNAANVGKCKKIKQNKNEKKKEKIKSLNEKTKPKKKKMTHYIENGASNPYFQLPNIAFINQNQYASESQSIPRYNKIVRSYEPFASESHALQQIKPTPVFFVQMAPALRFIR